MTTTVPTAGDEEKLVERLRSRAADERAIQRNNEVVSEALAPQLEAFERRDGSHNTFALRLMLDHRSCARHDAELAADWDEAAALITRLRQERDEARLNAAIIEGVSNELDIALSASNAEAERLREALTEARAYVLQAVNDDGGIENCEIGDRLALESIDAALQGSAKQ